MRTPVLSINDKSRLLERVTECLPFVQGKGSWLTYKTSPSSIGAVFQRQCLDRHTFDTDVVGIGSQGECVPKNYVLILHEWSWTDGRNIVKQVLK